MQYLPWLKYAHALLDVVLFMPCCTFAPVSDHCEPRLDGRACGRAAWRAGQWAAAKLQSTRLETCSAQVEHIRVLLRCTTSIQQHITRCRRRCCRRPVPPTMHGPFHAPCAFAATSACGFRSGQAPESSAAAPPTLSASYARCARPWRLQSPLGRCWRPPGARIAGLQAPLRCHKEPQPALTPPSPAARLTQAAAPRQLLGPRASPRSCPRPAAAWSAAGGGGGSSSGGRFVTAGRSGAAGRATRRQANGILVHERS